MRVMHCACAGLDVHQKTVVACTMVSEAGGEPKVEKRVFGISTSQVLEMSDWLGQQEISHIAMESTGTYWRPVWAVLEGRVRKPNRSGLSRRRSAESKSQVVMGSS